MLELNKHSAQSVTKVEIGGITFLIKVEGQSLPLPASDMLAEQQPANSPFNIYIVFNILWGIPMFWCISTVPTEDLTRWHHVKNSEETKSRLFYPSTDLMLRYFHRILESDHGTQNNRQFEFTQVLFSSDYTNMHFKFMSLLKQLPRGQNVLTHAISFAMNSIYPLIPKLAQSNL